MNQLPYQVNVSSRYGAPMGRASDPFVSLAGRTVHLRRIRLVDYDYDPGGAYWGSGVPLWCAWVDVADARVGRLAVYLRAKDRNAAKAKLPGTRFYR